MMRKNVEIELHFQFGKFQLLEIFNFPICIVIALKTCRNIKNVQI
jgi:hypothetical protein